MTYLPYLPILEIVAPNICNLKSFVHLFIAKNAYIFKTTSQEKNFNSVRNLITFSVVFTNKNGINIFNPPPPPIKDKVKAVLLLCKYRHFFKILRCKVNLTPPPKYY